MVSGSGSPCGRCAHLFEPQHEGFDALARGRGTGTLAAAPAGRLPEAHAEALGGLLQLFERAGADTPGRKVDDAQQRAVVVGIGDQAQVGERVLHLLTLEKAQPAVHPVG